MKASARVLPLKKLGLLGTIALSAFFLSRFMKGTRDDIKEPRGSFGLPLIGETLGYVRNPHKFFETRVKKYGPVFKTSLLGKPVVCFTGPEAFTFFANQSSFRREGANPTHVRELLCQQSLPLIDGPEHQSMRNLVMRVSRAERKRTTWVSTSSDYVRVMDQRLCQWLLCQANSYPVR